MTKNTSCREPFTGDAVEVNGRGVHGAVEIDLVPAKEATFAAVMPVGAVEALELAKSQPNWVQSFPACWPEAPKRRFPPG